MDADLRAAVIRRDRYCLKCGSVLGVDAAVHHRKLRKHGGVDALTNLIGLHHGCHNVQPGSVHQEPKASFARGLLVHSWDDPASTPLILPSGRLVLLTEDGKYQPIGDRDEQSEQPPHNPWPRGEGPRGQVPSEW